MGFWDMHIDLSCSAIEYITFACGYQRNNSQVKYYKCSLDANHEGAHYDKRFEQFWYNDPAAPATKWFEGLL